MTVLTACENRASALGRENSCQRLRRAGQESTTWCMGVRGGGTVLYVYCGVCTSQGQLKLNVYFTARNLMPLKCVSTHLVPLTRALRERHKGCLCVWGPVGSCLPAPSTPVIRGSSRARCWPDSELGSPRAADILCHPHLSPGLWRAERDGAWPGFALMLWKASTCRFPPGSAPLDPRVRPQWPHLVVDEQLDGVVAPLYQHNLIGLPRHSVGEWRANARRGTGPQPQADGKGVQLGQCLLDLAVQVVCAERKGHFECIW